MPSDSAPYRSWIHLFGLMVMAAGLPSSNWLMSIGQVILAVNWVAEGSYRIKIKRFLDNKPALLFSSLLLLHLLGLLYTADFDYATWDLRNKLPLLVLPFIMASGESLSRERLNKVLGVFIASVLITSVICSGELTPVNNWVRSLVNQPDRVIRDARNISSFISHIRFSLMICLSICWLAWQVARSRAPDTRKIAYAVASLWLIIFLFLLESVTGLAILLFIFFASLIYLAVKRKKRWVRLASLGMFILIPALILGFLGNMVNEYYKVNDEDAAGLPKYTASGNLYFHDLGNRQAENGNYVWRYVCHLEIEPAWERRSDIPFKGKDKAGQNLEYTLFRYMTSRGLAKDAEGLAQMGDEEVKAVENGVANVRFSGVADMEARIYGIIWQIDDYRHHGDPGGHSLSQRWEYWKTGLNLLKTNLWIGVGTGDVYNAMQAQYERDGSLLAKAYRKHPHNQYLSIALAFGLPGLAWFLISLLYPVYLNRNRLNYTVVVFVVIALLSMLTEDTLETQAGVTFVAFFYGLFFFSFSKEPPDSAELS